MIHFPIKPRPLVAPDTHTLVHPRCQSSGKTPILSFHRPNGQEIPCKVHSTPFPHACSKRLSEYHRVNLLYLGLLIGTGQAEAVEELVDAWSREDWQSAARWAESLPAGPALDSAAASLCS